jgi:hypothetical protein
MNRLKILFALPLFSAIIGLNDAQAQLNITPLTGEINFDGKPDEAAWQQIPQFDMTMHYPVFGNQPSEDSDIRITYDKDFLWIGAILYYKDISKWFPQVKKGMKPPIILMPSGLFWILMMTMKMPLHFLPCPQV